MLFVRSCHGSAGREAGRTARPRTTTNDRARTTTHDRPRTTDHAWPTTHARPRTTAYDHARPTTPAIFVWGSCTHPTPGGFRGLNCLARLALARERTPSRSKTYHTMSLVPPTNTNDHVLSLQSRPKTKLIPNPCYIKSNQIYLSTAFLTHTDWGGGLQNNITIKRGWH